MLTIIIGNKAYSSWSLRGWLAVRQSGLPHQEVLAPLYDDAWPTRRMQGDLAVSNGKVPTLWDGDVAVWDSLAIIDYLDARTGGTLFWPQDKAALALARSISAEMHSGYQPLRRACCMNVRRSFAPQEPSAAVRENIDRICALWELARARFGADGDFLFGAFGAADIMFAPVASRFRTYQLPATPVAQAYVDAIMSHAWVAQWVTEAHGESWVLPQYEQDADYSG